jgi:hypothetical protein
MNTETVWKTIDGLFKTLYRQESQIRELEKRITVLEAPRRRNSQNAVPVAATGPRNLNRDKTQADKAA